MPPWPLPPSVDAIYPSRPGGLTAPTLSNWQFHYGGSGGVTFGAGQPIRVTLVEGLGGLPTINSQDQAFPRDTGEYVGVDAMGGRDITIDVSVQSGIVSEMSVLGGAVFAGGVIEQPLWFQLPSLGTLCSMCRPRSRSSIWDPLVEVDRSWASVIALHATDPRLYAQGASSSSASSGSGTVALSVTNGGNVETRPVVVLTGPQTVPQITNTTIGATVAFATGTTIATGDQVVIDFSTPHTVQYFTGGITNAPWNGGTGPVYSVYNWLDQSATSWWTLLPGVNALSLATTSGSLAAGALQVWHADATIL